MSAQVEMDWTPAIDAIREAVASFKDGEMFNAESVRDRLSMSVRETLATRPNVMGQVFKTLARRGQIEHAGWAKAQRGKRRNADLRCWRWRP